MSIIMLFLHSISFDGHTLLSQNLFVDSCAVWAQRLRSGSSSRKDIETAMQWAAINPSIRRRQVRLVLSIVCPLVKRRASQCVCVILQSFRAFPFLSFGILREDASRESLPLIRDKFLLTFVRRHSANAKMVASHVLGSQLLLKREIGVLDPPISLRLPRRDCCSCSCPCPVPRHQKYNLGMDDDHSKLLRKALTAT